MLLGWLLHHIFKSIVWAFFLIGITSYVYAQSSIELDNQPYQDINRAVDYLIITDPELGPSGDNIKSDASNWLSYEQFDPQIRAYGRSNVDSIWLRIRINNNTQQRQERLIELANPLLDRIDVEYYLDNQVDSSQTRSMGRAFPFNQHLVGHRLFLFPIDLKPSQTITFYLKIKAKASLFVPLKLWKFGAFFKHDQAVTIQYGLIFGVMLLMFFYSLMAYWLNREKSYLYFALFVTFATLNQLSLSGYAFQYLWPMIASINQYSGAFFTTLSALSLCFFSIKFLNLRKHEAKLKIWKAVVVGFIAIVFALVYLAILQVELGQYLLISLFFLLVFMSITAIINGGFLWLKDQQKSARFYTLGMLTYLVVIISALIIRSGPEPEYKMNQMDLPFAFTLSLALLSLAITDRVRVTQRQLDQTRKSIGQILESIPTILIIMDKRFKIVDVNGFGINRLGYGQSIVHQSIDRVFAHKSSLDQIKKMIADGHNKTVEIEYITQDKKIIPVLFSYVNVTYGVDGLAHILCVAQDMTELKTIEIEKENYQKQLFHAEKLKTIGTLTSGIAHEIKNILTPILGFSELLFNSDAVSGEQKTYLKQILVASQRGKGIIDSMLKLSRQEENTETTAVDFNKSIQDTLLLIESTKPQTVTINKQFFDGELPVIASDHQIYQILYNLCDNALHALPERIGSMTITTEKISLDAAKAKTLSPLLLEGKYAKLSVKDNGIGMTPKVQAHIFDAYYTTKQVGKGTGLGLSIVYNIIQSIKGVVTVNSRSGQGSVFCVYLPLLAEKISTPHYIDGEKTKGYEHILYVDDEPAITLLMSSGLEKLGYQVSATEHSLTALKWVKENPNRYDLIVSDYSMPDLNGSQLANSIRKFNKSVPIVFVTAKEHEINAHEIAHLGIAAQLSKPILINELHRCIRNILSTH